MKTRTLMLLSLACGIAIMAAGAVFLFQLSTADAPEPPTAVGDTVEVGDMNVVVVESTESGGRHRVSVSLDGAADDAPAAGFRMIASGRPLSVADTNCVAFDGDQQRCDVEFDVALADGSSRVLFYQRGERTVRWVLAD